jgi:short-subunit dehydrogenase
VTPQTALVTGASVGIGQELARLLAADGHALVLVARDAERLNRLADELRKSGSPHVRVLPTDLSKPDACPRLAESLTREKIDIDILINNAGFGVHGPFARVDLQKQLDLLQVNITALTHLTGLLLPGMIQRRRGRVMNVASVAAFVPGPYLATYFASKAYVVSFSLALSYECRGTGVTVTAVCPGPTQTEFFTRAGISSAALTSGHMMSAESVARIGYKAMLKGKPLNVTGWTNKLLAQSTRLAPRMLAARAVGGRQRNLPGEKDG